MKSVHKSAYIGFLDDSTVAWKAKTIESMKREKIAILPSLYDFGGSMDEKNKWYVQFSVKNPRTGAMERKKMYAGLHSIKNRAQRYKAAEKIILEYSEKLRAGWNPFIDNTTAIYSDQLQYKYAARIYQDRKAGNITVNYFINRYLKERLSGLDPNTISTYTSKYRVFEMWCQRENYADKDITVFTVQVVQLFFSYLNNERQSSHITYKKYKQLIFGLFEFVVDLGKLSFNPVQRLPKCTRVVDKAPSPISDLDVEKFIERIKPYRQLYLSVLFEYYCLMRPTEIRFMKVKWIDFGRSIIYIPPEISKTRRPKTPIIPIEFMELLRNEFSLHNEPKDFYVIGKINEKPGKIPLGKNTMRNRFNKIRTELNMPAEYHYYSWKHTANGRLEDESIPVYDRMMQNGHTSIVTTEKYTRKKLGFKSDVLRLEYPVLTAKTS
jgi:integrase